MKHLIIAAFLVSLCIDYFDNRINEIKKSGDGDKQARIEFLKGYKKKCKDKKTY